MVTIPEAQRLLEVMYPSAKHNIDKLVQAGIIQQVGESSYGKTFLASEISEVIASEI